jgi:SAM-dependent methyltransferase
MTGLRTKVRRWLRWEETAEPSGRAARAVRRYLRWNNDWHGPHALRYLPVVRTLRRAGARRILEVGSGDRGVAPFLGTPVVSVDLDFDPEGLRRAGPLVVPVRARIHALPFPRGAFDAVLAIDVLEHLPPAARAPAVRELARVASRLVVIAVPCGERAARMEARLDRLHLRRFGIASCWLAEHRQHGLPEAVEIARILGEALPDGRLTVIRNAPLPLWYAIEALEVAVPRNYVRRVLTGGLVRLASHWNTRLAYRHIFVVERQP